jgi:diguanylate cyclase (GGDEF)-like protein
MARALAQHASDSIQSADNIVVSLVNSVERTKKDGVPLRELNPFLSQRVAELPILQALSILDEGGNSVASSEAALSKNINFRDQEYFLYHQNKDDRDPHIGPAIHIKTTGERILTVSRRLNNSKNNFAGIVVATLRLDYFQYFYAELDIGRSGVIFLANDEGTLLVRHPFVESVLGSSIAKSRIFDAYRMKGPIATVMVPSMIDQKVRLYSYRQLEKYPLLIAVGIGKEEIFAPWREKTFRLVVICGLLLMLLSLFGAYLIRQINKRQTSESELQHAKLELESLNSELEKLASEDGLTGLFNRRKFDTTLKQEYIRAIRNRTSLALIMIDVDKFKQFNDIYGHPAGDDCLTRIGNALKNLPSRSSDLVARYGGEEMVILLPKTDIDGAERIAKRARVLIESLVIPHSGNRQGVVTISAGVAAHRPTLGDPNPIALVKAADEALYSAKARGRNCISR